MFSGVSVYQCSMSEVKYLVVSILGVIKIGNKFSIQKYIVCVLATIRRAIAHFATWPGPPDRLHKFNCD